MHSLESESKLEDKIVWIAVWGSVGVFGFVDGGATGVGCAIDDDVVVVGGGGGGGGGGLKTSELTLSEEAVVFATSTSIGSTTLVATAAVEVVAFDESKPMSLEVVSVLVSVALGVKEVATLGKLRVKRTLPPSDA